ncbi:uncharacterized protein LOC119585955 [Penaeus monodon]|uniref:uncharacterized protein LOC119585955 n=1 Tax=Penaeus monodon TaxID=6687 RepID=UPI0018A7BC24|nr:uncharacterized protein LOC119585955 [Penaeus monodon]
MARLRCKADSFTVSNDGMQLLLGVRWSVKFVIVPCWRFKSIKIMIKPNIQRRQETIQSWKTAPGKELKENDVCDSKCGECRTVVRPAMLYGAEAWHIKKDQMMRLVAEMRMLRWMCEVTRIDRISNDRIRGTMKV